MDKNRTYPMTQPRSNAPMWIFGILAAVVIMGVLLWGFGDRTDTAGRRGDTNTGDVTRTAPPAAPMTGGVPARP
jgi:hypothetical protein